MTRPLHPADKQSAKQSHLLFAISDCGKGKNAPCAHNKVELNYQLGHLISQPASPALIVSIQWRFVVIVIEVRADIIGARDNEKEVELT